MASLDNSDGNGADAEVQKLEPHSFLPESGDKVHHWRCDPLQETLPLDEETEVLDGETELYGETQLLEEDEEGLTLFEETQLQGEGREREVVDVQCHTQIVDDCNQRAAALDSNGEDGSQKTEVLQDDDNDNLLDDGATPNVEENCHISKRFGPKVTNQENTQVASTDLSDHPCEEGLSAHSVSQANEEALPGSRRKSISAVRTASLRISGYAAISKLTPKSAELDMSTCNGIHTNQDHKKRNALGGTQNRPQVIDGNVATIDLECASVLDSEARDQSSKTSSELTDRNKCTRDGDMRHTTGNKRVRKLFEDKINDKEDEPASKTKSSTGKADPLEVLGTEFQDDIDSGLSYICSQEPGELSQANALDVVDRLFCIDEIGAPQIASAGDRIKTILPPIASVKGAQSLAKSAKRSPIRKETTFDWIDANEDEGGGDFYNKIKNAILLSDKQLKKSKSQPKTRDPSPGRNIAEGGKCKSMVPKPVKLRSSDSKIQANKLLNSSDQLASSSETHKRLFKEKSETLLIKPRRQNQDEFNFHKDVNSTNGIGPDTQVAVEAMETLASGICVEDTGEAKSVETRSTKSSKRSTMKRMPPKQAINVVQPSGAEKSLRRSKRTKLADAMENGGNSCSPPNNLDPRKGVGLVEKVRGSISLDEMVTKEQSLQKAVTRNSSVKNSLENSSVKKRLIEASGIDGCKTKSVGKRTRTSRSQLLLNQKILQKYTSSPVANRTRLAAEAKISRENECCPNISTEPEDNDKMDHTLTKDDALTCDSSYTSPFTKPIDKGSPVCIGLEPRVDLAKSSLRSSVARELIKLQTSEVTSPNVLQDTRRRRDMSSIRILFSRHLDDDITKHQKKILSRLGVSIATSISDATHFIADKFVRTRNLLEAMAVGKHVVSPMWMESCGQASCFIDEKAYILRDTKKEKEIGFSMPASLASACRKPLLQGKRVFITPTVKPDRDTVSCLVKAAGGLPMERIARSLLNDATLLDDLLVISCEEDYAACTPLLEKGVEVFSSELLLNGIVIQKLEYERHRLFLNHVKRTRSTIWLRNEVSNQFHPVGRRK